MALILRVDVDKPYGHSNIITRLMSKVAEDYWFPKFHSIYLYHLENFLQYCNAENIAGFIYHRICTAPNDKITELLKSGNHKFGMHAENTRDNFTFKSELEQLKNISPSLKIDSFSKHGSGEIKLGKYHYPKYEPEKYFEWAKENQIEFYFGNGIAKNNEGLKPKDNFYPNMFWIERDYRDENFSSIEKIVEIAATQDVPVLIHPCNYETHKEVRDDFKLLVKIAKENNINWKVF